MIRHLVDSEEEEFFSGSHRVYVFEICLKRKKKDTPAYADVPK